jgi:hypothetical protein
MSQVYEKGGWEARAKHLSAGSGIKYPSGFSFATHHRLAIACILLAPPGIAADRQKKEGRDHSHGSISPSFQGAMIAIPPAIRNRGQ